MTELLAALDPETRGLPDHDWKTRRYPTASGRDLIVFNERPEPRDLSHTDDCNGDHSDVSGRCGKDPVE